MSDIYIQTIPIKFNDLFVEYDLFENSFKLKGCYGLTTERLANIRKILINFEHLRCDMPNNVNWDPIDFSFRIKPLDKKYLDFEKKIRIEKWFFENCFFSSDVEFGIGNAYIDIRTSYLQNAIISCRKLNAIWINWGNNNTYATKLPENIRNQFNNFSPVPSANIEVIHSSRNDDSESCKIEHSNCNIKYSSNDLTHLHLNYIVFEYLKLSKVKLKSIQIVIFEFPHDPKRKRIEFSDVNIDSGTDTSNYIRPNKDNLYAHKRIEIEELKLNKFTVINGKFEITDLHIKNKTILRKADVENVSLFGVSWEKNHILEVISSEFRKFNLRATELPNIKVSDYSLSLKRNAYHQLKGLSEEQNDSVKALRFYQKEMYTHYEEITWNKSYRSVVITKAKNKSWFLWFWRKTHNMKYIHLLHGFLYILRGTPLSLWKNRWGERFTIWTNLAFSDYGNSWLRPFSWLIIISFIFTPGVIYSSPDLELVWINDDNFSYTNMFQLWAYLINPTHKGTIKFLGDSNVIGFTDLFYRVLVGAMIFYTLKGLRKYTYK